MQLTFTLDSIDGAAQYLLQHIAAPCIALYGSMGAGKTTLTRALCTALNVSEAVSSPTYALMQEYTGTYNGKTVVVAHMDWYRLHNAEQVQECGLEEYLHDADTLCIIEWPERAEEILPHDTTKVYVDVVDEQTRQIRW